MNKGIRASEIQRQPVEWLWEKRIPRGMISLVAGPPGVGKSLFGYFLAGTVAAGGEHVIVANGEESISKTALARIEAVLLSADTLPRAEHKKALGRIEFLRPELPQEIDALRASIIRDKAALVVIDPITAHLSVSIMNGQDVRRALTPLAGVAEETNAAIVLVSHTVKSIAKNAHPMNAIGGSGGGLQAAARMAFLFGRGEDEGEVRLSLVKSNVGPDMPSYIFARFVHDFPDGIDAPFLLEEGEGEESSIEDARIMLRDAGLTREARRAKREAASEFLIDFLRAGPVRVTEVYAVAEKNQHAQRTIRRAAEELGIVMSGGPCSTWALPPGLLDTLDDGSGPSDE